MMAKNHRTIIRFATVFSLAALPGVSAPVRVELRYETRDPYAVAVIFNAGQSHQVRWEVARDLLADGLVADSGEGDMRIGPCPDKPELLLITLRSPSGQATFETPAEKLAQFLNDTYDIVEPGDEHRWMSVDEALNRLLPNDL
ncbi:MULTISPECIES: SsgA family sporulation/cell division regulator [Saccharopolyspora]|uniref:SsgA family sporulation/cell division regulator n=3 Tax=Saccharopolyspora TaxID=1835 RepID=A0A4R4Y7F1_9PSEU|nr:SsgA family sporulation/cell division regulator [Saccharopolyspora elongata]TDD40351.1 SsgA family sporulation/cell division regulator [Saccharopolyspora elongata]SDZ42784.1 Streptomyces sporulation and cell division protein, SsgA [Saccharopolyspora shandongensis]